MSEEQPEQPRYVTQDQHRADMAELRLELANTLASLDKRTELIAQDLMAFRREVTERFDRTGEQISELRQEMQTSYTDLRQEMQTFRTETRQDMLTFRQEMDRFRNTTTRQLWVMVGIMSSAIIGTLIKLLFFPAP